MRALKTTVLSYGLQNIPVRIVTMIKDGGTGLSNACPHCQGDIGIKDYCKACGKEVPRAEQLKAYKIGKDTKTVITKEQIEQLKQVDEAILIEGRIPKSSIDQRMIQGGYYILPEKKVQKPWKMMYEALKGDNALVVRFSVRSRQKLGILTTDDSVIVMLEMAYAEQLVRVDEELEIPVTEKAIEQARGFINGLVEADINVIADDYKHKLEEFLAGTPMLEIKSKEVDTEEAFFTQVVAK